MTGSMKLFMWINRFLHGIGLFLSLLVSCVSIESHWDIHELKIQLLVILLFNHFLLGKFNFFSF